jgi:hypothetical protein
MEPSFKKDYQDIIDLLENAKTGIESVTNPEIQMLVTRLKLDLTKHINFLKVRIGEAPDAEAKPAAVPLKKVMGRVIGGPVIPSSLKITPRALEMEEVKAKVEDIYGKFAITDSDQLYDTLSDIEIRGVAKKVGLPVTDNTPKRITVEFINQIKDAIVKQHVSGRLPVPELNAKHPDTFINEPGSNDLTANGEGDPKHNDDGENGTGINTGEGYDITIGPQNDKPAENGNIKMLNELSELTNAAILEAYEEDQIKSFALMANVDITDKTKIDSKFITQLKEAIKTLHAGNNK